MEWLKEWWAVIAGFIATVFWLSRLEHMFSDHRTNPVMTKAMCDECRAGCMRGNTIQFNSAERELGEIKKTIQDNHRELVGLIMQDR